MDGCLLRGSKVVVPPGVRGKILEALHSGHPGISRMRSLGRSYVGGQEWTMTLHKQHNTAQAVSNNKNYLQRPTIPLEMARRALVPPTFRLGWAIYEKDVPDHGRCSLQMPGDHTDDQDHRRRNNRNSPTIDSNTWPSGDNSN